MPPWEVLPEKDRWNIVAYIKTFAAREVQGGAEEARASQGRRLVRGVDQARQGDVRGDRVPQVPRHGRPRRRAVAPRAEGRLGPPDRAREPRPSGGRSAAALDRTEIATRLANGVLGTPMPSFLDSVEKPEDIWHLTNYILSLGPDDAELRDAGHGQRRDGRDPRRSQRRVLDEGRAQQHPAHGAGHRRSAELQSRRSTCSSCAACTTTRRSRSTSRGTIRASPRPTRRRSSSPTRCRSSSRAKFVAGHRAAVLPHGRRLGRRLPPALGRRQGGRGVRERPGEDQGARRRRDRVEDRLPERPVPRRDQAPARRQGRRAADVPAVGVRARRVPRVGRRRGGDRRRRCR